MADSVETPASAWWRFDRYEIRDGRIGPGRRAKLKRYDPWEARGDSKPRQAGRPARGLETAAYNELAALASISPYSYKTQDEARITAWCASNGLLGILLHQTQSVRLSPRVLPSLSRRSKREKAIEAQDEYYPSSRGWLTLFRRSGWKEPEVILTGLEGRNIRSEPLSATWHRFFPSVARQQADSFAYPNPGSEDFWRLYAEPVDLFLERAAFIERALRGLTPEQQPDKYGIVEGPHWGLLNDIVAPVRNGIVGVRDRRRSPTRFKRVFTSPSLFAALGMMILYDVAHLNRVPRSCANQPACGRPFLAVTDRDKYCSRRCLNTVKVRNYRKTTRDRQASTRRRHHDPDRGASS
jgi:hypothetical protein